MGLFVQYSFSSSTVREGSLGTTYAATTSPAQLVRRTDNSALCDLGMVVQHGLDLRRIDVLACGNDHIVLAAAHVTNSFSSNVPTSPVYRSPCRTSVRSFPGYYSNKMRSLPERK